MRSISEVTVYRRKILLFGNNLTQLKLSVTMTIFTINTKLLPLKVNYFLTYASKASIIPFIPLYGKQMGIRTDVVGYIYAIISCILVLSKPLIGGLVDHFQKLKIVLIGLTLIQIVSALGLNFIPTATTKSSNYTNSSLICVQNISYVINNDLKECETLILSNCFETCISSCSMCEVKSEICKTSIEENSTYGKERAMFYIPFNCSHTLLEKCDFDRDSSCHEDCIGNSVTCRVKLIVNTTLQTLLFGIFATFINVCYGSLSCLSDAACFNALGDKPQLFGKQIVWATIGWGSFGLISGYLNQIFTGDSETYSFSAGFYLMSVLMLIDIPVLMKLEVKDVKLSRNIFKDIGHLVGKPRIIHFLFLVFLSGVFIGFSRTYLLWHLRSLDASQLNLGLTLLMMTLGTTPFFFYSGWIIAKIGHVNTYTMSFSAHGVLFLSYSFLSNPWWSLPIAVLEGPCFGTLYAAMTSYAKIIAPTGTEATVQGIASATYEGLGFGTGNLLGGYLLHVLGERTTFFWTGIVSFTFAMKNFIVNAIFIAKNQTT